MIDSAVSDVKVSTAVLVWLVKVSTAVLVWLAMVLVLTLTVPSEPSCLRGFSASARVPSW